MGRPDHDAWTCRRPAGLPLLQRSDCCRQDGRRGDRRAYYARKGSARFPRQATICAGDCRPPPQGRGCEAGMNTPPALRSLKAANAHGLCDSINLFAAGPGQPRSQPQYCLKCANVGGKVSCWRLNRGVAHARIPEKSRVTFGRRNVGGCGLARFGRRIAGFAFSVHRGRRPTPPYPVA